MLDDQRLPVGGAMISAVAISRSPLTVQTASDGTYTLQVLAGTYDVTASKAGWTRRTRTATVSADTTLDFGTMDNADNTDPHFLSDVPEVEHVDVKEDQPGGPLAMTFNLSEPITADSQKNFAFRLSIDSGSGGTQFLKAVGISEPYLQTDTSWDADGKAFTLKYKQPYLASGPGLDTYYTAYLKQAQLATKDPDTQEYQWEDMGIVDVDGNKPLAKGRAAYAFLMDQLNPLPATLLTNFTYGYYTDRRRWNLTHQGNFRFMAARDTTLPQLLSVQVTSNAPIGNTNEDLMTLRFNKPMSVVKDRDNLQFTRLSNAKEKHLIAISISKYDNGANPVSLDPGNPRQIEFSRTDPNIVIFHYGANTFVDQKWVDVTLLDDMRDPVNNPMDPAHSHLSGPVLASS